MPRTCNRDHCNGAVTITDDNGVTDPTKDRKWVEDVRGLSLPEGISVS